MTYWFVPILIGLILLVIFWLIIGSLYNKKFNSEDSSLDIHAVQMFCQFSEAFQFSIGFAGLKYHLIIKFVIFLVLGLVTHFTDSLNVSSIVLSVFLIPQVFVTYKRIKEYREYEGELVSVMKPLFISCMLVTIYQVILYGLNFAVYYFNV